MAKRKATTRARKGARKTQTKKSATRKASRASRQRTARQAGKTAQRRRASNRRQPSAKKAVKKAAAKRPATTRRLDTERLQSAPDRSRQLCTGAASACGRRHSARARRRHWDLRPSRRQPGRVKNTTISASARTAAGTSSRAATSIPIGTTPTRAARKRPAATCRRPIRMSSRKSGGRSASSTRTAKS